MKRKPDHEETPHPDGRTMIVRRWNLSNGAAYREYTSREPKDWKDAHTEFEPTKPTKQQEEEK